MELIDILDDEGNKTGIIKSKLEVHKQGLWHQVAHIWCVNSNNEILLQHRSKLMENYPDMWDISVAGHISSGEELISAAIREIKEEIGLDLNPAELKLIGTVKKETVSNNETYFDNEFDNIYLVKIDLAINQLRLQEEEVEALSWVPIIEFKKMVAEKRPDLVPHAEEYEILFKII